MDKTYKRKSVLPSKVSDSKRYEYLRKIEIEGLPRVRAYAETIDPTIYEVEPNNIHARLEYLKEAWKNYDEIREMVLAERTDWNLRRSAMAQDKAMELLNVTLDRAIEIAKDPEGDAKTFNAAIQTLKTIMPALTNSRTDAPITDDSGKRKARAERFIH